MPTKTRGKGRPKKAKAEQRGVTLRIRLTQSERDALDGAAAGRSLDVSAWCRMILMEAARTAVKPPVGGEG